MLKVVDFTGVDTVNRELVLVKVKADNDTKPEVLRLIDIFRAKIVDVAPRFYTIEMTGGEGKVNAFLQMLRPLGIKDIVRTGKIAIAGGCRVRPRRRRKPANGGKEKWSPCTGSRTRRRSF